MCLFGSLLESGKTDPGHFGLVIKVFSTGDACRSEHVNPENPDRNSQEKYGFDNIQSKPAA